MALLKIKTGDDQERSSKLLNTSFVQVHCKREKTLFLDNIVNVSEVDDGSDIEKH